MRSINFIKKKILILGVIGLLVVLMVGSGLLLFYYSKRERWISEKIPKFPNEKPPPPTSPQLPPPTAPVPVFRIDNLPAERENNWGEIRELNPTEEKTVIECLASRVKIDKAKSYFDYKWGFNMIPAIEETSEDHDRAFYLFTDKGKIFVKVNNFSDLSRFEYEKESMLTINEAVPDMAPRPLVLGNLPQGGKFLVVNFIEARWDDRLIIENQKALSWALVQLHQKKSPNRKFGFRIGKNNQWKDDWASFFLENRWQPLWKRVLEKYPANKELKKRGTIIGEKVIPDLLGNLPVEPVLIHGNLIFDAWDINSQTKQPWLFDTYSYYGHNEMDLSLIHYNSQDINWIGGKVPEGHEGEFHKPEFLTEYQKYHALPVGFEKRCDLYRFYNWLFRNIARDGHPNKKFLQEALTKMKKLGQNYS